MLLFLHLNNIHHPYFNLHLQLNLNSINLNFHSYYFKSLFIHYFKHFLMLQSNIFVSSHYLKQFYYLFNLIFADPNIKFFNFKYYYFQHDFNGFILIKHYY